MIPLILASGSASRQEILRRTGYPFVVEVSSYDEDMSLDLAPKELAIFLSQGKARAVAKNHKEGVILAADSFGVFSGELLGKPHSIKRAKEMLSMLNGNAHQFITGFTLIDAATSKEYSEAVESIVHFKKLSDKTIDEYIAKGDVVDKAGAYTVQGLGSKLIEKIEGDPDNVMGLPLAHVSSALTDFGIVIT